MQKTLNVLILEDNPSDAELLLVQLRKAGYDPVWHLTSNEKDFLSLLKPDLDIILSDYSMPQFTGTEALRLLSESGYDIPFILISGTIGEEIAVESMRQGADDYLMKDRMARLGTAIDSALSKKALRDEKRRSGQILEHERELAQKYLDIADVMIIALDREGNITLVNRKGAQNLGYPAQDLMGKNWFETCIPAAHRLDSKQRYKAFMKEQAELNDNFKQTIITRSGEERIIDWHSTQLWEWEGDVKQRIGALSSGEDITDREIAQMELTKKSELISELFMVGKQFGQTLDLDEIYKNVYASISNRMPCDHFIISSYDPRDKLIRCEYVIFEGKVSDISQIPPLPLNQKGQGTQSKVILSGEGLYLADYVTFRKTSQKAYYVNQNGVINHADVDEKEHIPRSALIVPLIREGKSVGVIQVFSYQINDYSDEDMHFLEALSPQIAASILNADLYNQAENSKENISRALKGTIDALASTVEVRDPYTAGHQKRTSSLASAIAREMELPEEQIEAIQMAGIIHDLGKIHVPAEILSKPGKLNDLEFDLIKTHPQIGFDLLKNIAFPWPLAEIVLQHHEMMDGSGYTQGLKGEDILLEARILCVADIVEAMSSHRPYRAAMGIEKALDQIRTDRGITLDADVVDACLKVFEAGFDFEDIA
jgi:PAS domain S-box-containing protein